MMPAATYLTGVKRQKLHFKLYFHIYQCYFFYKTLSDLKNWHLVKELTSKFLGARSEFTNYVSNISIADGKLHHVAVSVNRDQPDGGRWYLDGVEVVGERFNPTRRGSLSNSKPLVIESQELY